MNMPKLRLPSWILPVMCVFMALGLLSVGLWPFNPFLKNEVHWLPSGKGVAFGEYGIAFSSGSVLPPASRNPDSICSLQIQVQPQFSYFKGAGTILAFYTPENPLRFTLLQYRDALLIRRSYFNEKNELQTVESDLEHVFLNTDPVTLTITSGSQGTSGYRNGVAAGTSSRQKFSCADLAGQLVIGDSPITHNSWQGSVLDLAVYDAHLTPQQVALEYAQLDSRSATLSAQHSEAQSAISHYPLTEGFGNVVHNTALSGADLSIPDRFRTLYRGFLIPPWEESADKLGIRDLAINILGFVPFGLLAFAYFRLHHDNARALALTVLAGFVITCTIEVLQAFIPGRLSGILDIITNTFGTYLGALLFRWQPIRNLAAKFDFYPAVNQSRRK
jgi:hypothetical protein